MKLKKIISAVFVIIFAVAVGVNVKMNLQAGNKLTDLNLANVEALAQSEHYVFDESQGGYYLPVVEVRCPQWGTPYGNCRELTPYRIYLGNFDFSTGFYYCKQTDDTHYYCTLEMIMFMNS